MIIDPETVANVIAEIAAQEITPRFGKLKDAEIDTKTGPTDFVTQADRAAEIKLQHALSDIYPAATFIGEEGAAANPSVLDALDSDDAFWIVDPLDGTRNFVQGRPEFGVIVALIENRETRAGWIYAAPDQAFAVASCGDGATWRGEKIPPLTAPNGELSGYRGLGNMNEPWKSRLEPPLRADYKTDPSTCAAYGYIRLLRGERHFALYSRCHPWDHAAGILMLTEIGGRAEYLDSGEPYRPYPTIGKPLLVSGSRDIWRAVYSGLMNERGRAS